MKTLHDWLLAQDLALWYRLHALWRTDVLDVVTRFLRNQFFWAPLYLFLLIFMPYNFGRRGWFWLLGFVLCFALGDSISGSLIKPLVHRVRPCNEPRLADYLHLIVPRSSGWSFPSSHATNHFALGTFCAVTFHHRLKWLWPFPMLWALLVGYSQVYVGVHYPLDVAAGAVLGALIGWIVAVIFNRRWRLHHPQIEPPKL